LRRAKNARAQLAGLNFFSRHKKVGPSQLLEYHDALLFLSAWPYDEKVFSFARDELKRLAELLQTHQHDKSWQYRLSGSGLPFTELRAQYSAALVTWLLKKFHDDVVPLEAGIKNDSLQALLRSILPGVEFYQAALDDLPAWKRIELVGGSYHDQEALSWMIDQVKNQDWSPVLKDLVYDQLKIFVSWKLKDEFYNRSFLRLSPTKIHNQNDRENKLNRRSAIGERLSKQRKLRKEEKEDLIAIARVSLAMYYRETDPFSFAGESETSRFNMGNGTEIALFGMIKERQLSLESYIGYMIFRNGIPVAYGGGWLFGFRCSIGINIYPPFRGGRSSELFLQVLRLYHQEYGVKTFVVKPYQFGKKNPEGIKSGAFWFYYKLGFRPSDEVTKTLAAAECKKVNSNRSYRTPATLLKAFTNGNLELKLSNNNAENFDAEKLSFAVTKLARDQFAGNRTKASAFFKKQALSFLGLQQHPFHSANESKVFMNWASALSCLPGRENWNKNQRAQFLKIVEWKSSGCEKKFLLTLQRHNGFWSSVKKLPPAVLSVPKNKTLRMLS